LGFVPHIFGISPQEKMLGIYAARDITPMQDMKALGDWTVSELIGKTVR
jgi:hypothetical protein